MTTMTETLTPTLDYKVADITLQNLAEKKFLLLSMKCLVLWQPERNMALLNRLRELKSWDPYTTIQTAVLIETLVELGACSLVFM